MNKRILKDIRIYESNQPNISGNTLPHDFGKIYASSPSFHFSAIRIARKLNELEFSLDGPDHFYINFTTILSPNEIEISNRKPALWIQYVNIGLDQNLFNQQPVQKQEEQLVELIFKALKAASDKNQHSKIENCETALEKFGKALTMIYKVKETTNHEVTASYQIAPEDLDSKLIINYRNKKTNEIEVFSQSIRFYEDAYSLVDKIAIKNNVIEIQPRKSFKANLYNGYYNTPLQFKLIS